MLKVVLDTNQFVSALLSPRGTPAQVLQAWRERAYVLVISRALQREIERVLTYPKIRTTYRLESRKIADLMELIKREAVVVADPAPVDVITADPSDNEAIAVAAAARADYIISGDQHLLALRRYRNIAIVTATKFLQSILHRYA